jgi:hypothetical protein
MRGTRVTIKGTTYRNASGFRIRVYAPDGYKYGDLFCKTREGAEVVKSAYKAADVGHRERWDVIDSVLRSGY